MFEKRQFLIKESSYVMEMAAFLPSGHLVMRDIYSPLAQPVLFDFYDQQGRLALCRENVLQRGLNTLHQDLTT